MQILIYVKEQARPHGVGPGNSNKGFEGFTHDDSSLLALRGLRQEDHSKIKTRLGSDVSSPTAWAIQ